MTKNTIGDMLMVMTTAISLLFMVLALTLGVARKVYTATPPAEFKRRAARKQAPYDRLFKAVAYGRSLNFVLLGGIAIFGSLSLVLLARSAPIALSIPLIIIALCAVFIWLPASRVTKVSTQITLIVNPVLVWLLSRFHPLLSRGAEQLDKHYPVVHTGLFERSDILELINQQADQQDSRLSIEELAIVQRALTFGDYLVRDIVTPRSDIATVGETEVLSPIVIDELHQSKAPFILVSTKDGQIIGSLETHKLGLQTTGTVGDHLSPVYFLHENDTLREALHAFFVTNHPMFVVTNSFEEYVGIVTVESVLRQLLGHLPGDDFEQYANIAAVAARHPRPETASSSKIIKKPSTSK